MTVLELLTLFKPAVAEEILFGAKLGEDLLLILAKEARLAKPAEAVAEAHRLEVVSGFSLDAARHRADAERALIQAVEKIDPPRAKIVEAMLTRTSTIVPVPARVARYSHDLSKLKFADPCLQAIVRVVGNPGAATNALEAVGIAALQRLFARAGTSMSSHADLGMHCASSMESIWRHAQELEKLMPEILILKTDSPRYESLMSDLVHIGGTRWSIRGILNELAITSWPRYQQHMLGQLLHAEAYVERLGPGWRAIEQYGEMWLDGQLIWDAAILMLREEAELSRAIIHTTGQFKSEGELSVFRQIVEDLLRERDLGILRLKIKGREVRCRLELRDGLEIERYAVWSGGGAIPRNAEERLGRVGLRSVNLEGDFHLRELDAMTFVVMKITAKVYEWLKASGQI